MPRFLRAAALGLALAASLGPASASAATALPFGVPGHGRLLLAVPDGWRAQTKTIEEAGGGLALRFSPAEGAGFVAMVTVMALPGDALGPDAPRTGARISAERLAAGSVEKELPIEELRGPAARLAFVDATDAKWADGAPPEGEWRHVTQGVATVGDLAATFTILSDGKKAPARADALEMLRTVHPISAGEGAVVRVRAGSRSLSASLPGLEVLRVDSRPGGGGALVMGSLPGGFAATLTIEEAPPGIASAVDARETRWTNGAAKSPLEKTDVRLSSRGEMALVAYLVPKVENVEIRQRHVHAYLARGDAVAEAHLSKVRYEEADGAALDRILASVKLE